MIVQNIEARQVNTKYGIKPVYSLVMDDGETYKYGWKKPPFGPGTEVTFKYTEDKYGKSVDETTVKIGGSGVATPPVAAPKASTGFQSNKGVFPIPAHDGQRSILRQNALTNARELYAFVVPDADAKFDSAAAMKIIEVARVFELYTAGDLDVAEHKEKETKE